MSVSTRLNYWRRVGSAYLTSRQSQLTFWHEVPEVNPQMRPSALGPYYMTFRAKADYQGPRDPQGVPLLDYHGAIGRQHNPIAISQYGLGNYNLVDEGPDRKHRFLLAADWLVESLEVNAHGLHVWNHHFDWDYRTTLKAPWYSGLAQGQGVSLLVRAHATTGNLDYLETAEKAFEPMTVAVDRGGVLHVDKDGSTWIEEYIIEPPTHILNGLIWASWGAYDYSLATGSSRAEKLFDQSMKTLRRNLATYDIGFWSLYEHSGTKLKMIASPFYHRLHIVQLRVLARLTRDDYFASYADRWEAYLSSTWNRRRAMAQKAMFKLLYY